MLDIKRSGNVQILHLRNGENRFNRGSLDAINGALDEIEAGADPTALVVTGEGKFFSNGLDLDWMMGDGAAEVDTFLADFELLFARVLTFPMITVAALNGHVFAGGAMFSMSHDFRIMRTDRGFWCLPEVDLGMPLRPGMNAVVKARLPKATFHESIVTGKRYAAEEALEKGIVDAIAAEDEVLPRAIELAEQHVGKNRTAIVALKEEMYRDALGILREGAQHRMGDFTPSSA
jgi:enoyl-CoA hydratase/carnithine racemase